MQLLGFLSATLFIQLSLSVASFFYELDFKCYLAVA